jgi:Mg2+ and Co2+ transporter CorA
MTKSSDILVTGLKIINDDVKEILDEIYDINKKIDNINQNIIASNEALSSDIHTIKKYTTSMCCTLFPIMIVIIGYIIVLNPKFPFV